MIQLNTRQKITLARIVKRVISSARALVGLPARGVFVRDGVRWDLDLAEGIDFSIFLLGAFEPDVVKCGRRVIRDGDVVLDIGANIGAHTLHFARSVGPGGHVYAFEPTDYAFGKLSRHLSLNAELAPRVTASQLLLTDNAAKPVPSAIYSSWPLEQQDGLHEKHLGRLQATSGARAMTLDDFLETNRAGRVAFVKLDVDGHEIDVLRGAAATLLEHHPVILLELCPSVWEEHGYSLAELVGTLTQLGYGFCTLDDRELPSDAAALERLIPLEGSINVLAKAR